MNITTEPEELSELVDAIGAAIAHRLTYGPVYSRGAADALCDARRRSRPDWCFPEAVVVSLRRLVGATSVLVWADDDGSSILIDEEPALRPFLDRLAEDRRNVAPGRRSDGERGRNHAASTFRRDGRVTHGGEGENRSVRGPSGGPAVRRCDVAWRSMEAELITGPYSSP